jgi:tRNA(Ile)-lysidine synthase
MNSRTPLLPSWQSPVLKSLPRDGRYLVGVSGGRDSVALLHWLLSVGYKRLVVCHLNHKLRGRSSDADARFVQRLVDYHRLPFAVESVDVGAFAAKQKQSLETAARAARYDFFAATAQKRRCDTIFLGHNADDLVETFLMNLFRGSGTSGRSAMREVSQHRIRTRALTVVRPFLRVWRRQIDDYVRAAKLKFREDKTNRSLRPVRNRVRHRIIPLIEKELGRDVRATIWRSALIAADEEAWLADAFPELTGNAKSLPVRSLREMPTAQQRRVIQTWLKARQIGDISFELIERIRGLLDVASGPAKTNLPGDRHVRRRTGQLFVE